jgi:hypothetical protein
MEGLVDPAEYLVDFTEDLVDPAEDLVDFTEDLDGFPV